VSRFVLDASVALRWFLDDPVDDYAVKIRQLIVDGDRAVVPSIWTLEVVNSLLVAERKAKISAAAVDERLINIEELLDSYIESPIKGTPARRILTVARHSGLTSYDATYLDLAQSENLPLATLDAQLRKAAERAGVEILR
jgi:predicted nucleic acid-binding protein